MRRRRRSSGRLPIRRPRWPHLPILRLDDVRLAVLMFDGSSPHKRSLPRDHDRRRQASAPGFRKARARTRRWRSRCSLSWSSVQPRQLCGRVAARGAGGRPPSPSSGEDLGQISDKPRPHDRLLDYFPAPIVSRIDSSILLLANAAGGLSSNRQLGSKTWSEMLSMHPNRVRSLARERTCETAVFASAV